MEHPRPSRTASSRRIGADTDRSERTATQRTAAAGARADTSRAAVNASARTHITAIDGLRALAIIGVVAYHTRPSLLGGGFLGVTVFFVISGFLITRSLTAQLARTGTLSYGTYLVKRLKRLVPPVAVIIAFTALASYLVAPSLFAKAQSDALPSMLFVSNWVYIFRHVSYFAAAGLPSPLTHLWFLSLLMQFYLLWPIILLALYRSGLSRTARIVAVGVLAAFSAVLMAVMFDPNAAGSRVYYGLDTRATELLCGAVLAMLLPSRNPDASRRRRAHAAGPGIASDRSRRFGIGDLVGLALLAAMIVAFVVVRSDSTFLYRGGYLIAALLTALLLALAMVPGNLAGRVLSVAPMRYLGSRSFSLYLVHYPMLEMMNPATRTTDLAWWEWIVQAIALLVAAELFYRLIEHVPAGVVAVARAVGAAGAAGADAVRGLGNAGGFAGANRSIVARQAQVVVRRAIVMLSAVAVALLCVLPLNWGAIASARSAYLRPVVAQTAKPKTQKTQSSGTSKSETTAEGSDAGQSDGDGSGSSDGSADDQSKDSSGKLVPMAEKVPKNLDTTGWTYDASTGVCTADPLIISDSIELGARSVMDVVMPNAVQDNEVNRPITAFPDLYQQHVAAGEDRRVVIAALGANSASVDRPETLENVVASVQGKPLYFITVRSPMISQDWVNENLRSVAAKHDNVGIMDWHGLSEGHDEYFADDGTHLTQGEGLGAEAYSRMIVSALCGQ
ncbi:acyltransferase family protein [Bifidobacterium aerophilum]|uniref:Acyltransferase family protein n=1 Tax=Bifidobacterium aerophilum TaxID=1798155 RepID=A0A6N9Z7Q2_9BIFI|nr:acyltransferase family protein [Bifidobacterium aerophilum]NEG90466.1 acyltransferase family protein [Bifidobacterium aerophilum]